MIDLIAIKDVPFNISIMEAKKIKNKLNGHRVVLGASRTQIKNGRSWGESIDYGRKNFAEARYDAQKGIVHF